MGIGLAMAVCVAKCSSHKVPKKQEGNGLAVVSNGVKQGDIMFAAP
jgi:hypothetical protein